MSSAMRRDAACPSAPEASRKLDTVARIRYGTRKSAFEIQPLGLVAKGHDADLLIVDGNPLIDITTSLDPRMEIASAHEVGHRVVRRLRAPGPLAFGRGLEITVLIDELAFEGASAFLFGAVLDRYFARHVSINSFTETVLRSENRGEINRWEQQWGARPTL